MTDYDMKADLIEGEIRGIGENLEQMHNRLNGDMVELREALADQGREMKTRLGGVDGLTVHKVDKIANELAKSQEACDGLSRRLSGVELGLKRGGVVSDADSGVSQKSAKDFYLMNHARRFGPDMPFDEDIVDEVKYADYCRGFDQYLRRDDRALGHDEVKSLIVGSNPDGGYYVPSEISSNIVKKQFETSPMRMLATTQVISGSSLEIPVDYDEPDAGWAAETATRSDTATPKVKLAEISAHEIFAQPLISQKLLDDAAIDMENWLTNKIVEKFSRIENAAFVNGDGINKARGFLTYDDGVNYGEIEQIASGTSGEVTYDGLVDLVTSLKSGYQANGSFVFGRAVMAQILKLKDLQDRPLWQPAIEAGAASTLLGRPVILAEDMPAPVADSLSVAYGDFAAGYTIVDRLGVGILRDPYTKKPYVKFYATKRVGGAVVDFDAIKILKLA